MASKAEQRICQFLRPILADLPNGAVIEDSEPFQDVLVSLHWFVPEVLGEIYREWRYEALDGVFPVVARKSGDGEAEIFGLCILISDQTLTPIHLRVQLAPSNDEICWIECRLGQKDGNGLVVRAPYDQFDAAMKQLYLLDGHADAIDWAYKVTYGERRV